MTRHVFISYASTNHTLAEEVLGFLETRGFPCWIAPRNVRAGRDYGEEIITAIEDSAVVVLILSDDANSSLFVKNEVERAFSKKKTIVPFRIQNVPPSKAIELFVGGSHWIDAWNPPREHQLTSLARTVAEFLPSGTLATPAQSAPDPSTRVEASASRSSEFVVTETGGTAHELTGLFIRYPGGFGPSQEKRGILLRRGSAETLVEWARIDTLTFVNKHKDKGKYRYEVQVLLQSGKTLNLEVADDWNMRSGETGLLFGTCDLGEVKLRFADIATIVCPTTAQQDAPPDGNVPGNSGPQ